MKKKYTIYWHEDYKSSRQYPSLDSLDEALLEAKKSFEGYRCSIHEHDANDESRFAGKVIARISEDMQIEIT